METELTITQQDFCKKHNITERQYFGLDPIKHSLMINDTIIPYGFNPHTLKSLRMDNVLSVPIGFNPIVKEKLIMYRLMELPNYFKPSVGEQLIAMNVKYISDDCYMPSVTKIYLNNFNGVFKAKIINNQTIVLGKKATFINIFNTTPNIIYSTF